LRRPGTLAGAQRGRLAPDLIGQLADLRDLVGGEHQHGVAARVAHLLAKGGLAPWTAGHAVVGHRQHQVADVRAEAARQLGRAGVRVLQHAAQQTGGNDDVRAAAVAQYARNLGNDAR
jgi:hypothetical protein